MEDFDRTTIDDDIAFVDDSKEFVDSAISTECSEHI